MMSSSVFQLNQNELNEKRENFVEKIVTEEKSLTKGETLDEENKTATN